jgi:hypothetical protein
LSAEKAKRESAQASVLEALEVRFGAVPGDLAERVRGVREEGRLRQLHRQAILCADLEAFRAALPAP